MEKRTVRQNAEFAASITEIKSLNPALARECDVPGFAYHQMATDIEENSEQVNWYKISKLKFKDDEYNVDYASTRQISGIEDKDYEIVVEHFKRSTAAKNKLYFAYLTNLVLLYTRDKLRTLKADGCNEKRIVEPETIDGVELLTRVVNKAKDEIKSGDLTKIMRFLED